MLRPFAGQDVWVVERGQGQGPTRLFLHCSLGRHQSLVPLADALPAGRDAFFDMPGHGQSADWRSDDHQSDVLEIALTLLDGPAHLIGHSFGATVALRLAVERPDLVSRLTLIEPVLFAAARGTTAFDHHTQAFAPFARAWAAGDLDTASIVFVGMWGIGPAWADIPLKMRQKIMTQIHMIPATGPALDDDVHNVLGQLDRINCPVDLIEGGATQPVIAAIMDRLETDLANTTRTVVAGAGHMVPITHVSQVAAAISQG